jgi:Holliday junction resolvase
MNRKSKGSNAERELLHYFWNNGWACMRAAGSGSIQWPEPDLIAGKDQKRFAIECKTSGDEAKYIEKKQVLDLIEFSKIMNVEPLLAIKFNNKKWKFFRPEEMNQTEKSFMISKEEIELKGRTFEEIIEKKDENKI